MERKHKILQKAFTSKYKHNFNRLKFVKYLVVLLILFTPLILQAQDAGLYKDGVKVLDIQADNTSTKEFPGVSGSNSTKSAGKAFRDEITGKQSSSSFPEKRAFFGLLLKVRGIVINGDTQTDPTMLSDESLLQLISLQENLIKLNEAVLNGYDEILQNYQENNYPIDKLNRLERTVSGHRHLADTLIQLLTALKYAYNNDDSQDRDNIASELSNFFSEYNLQPQHPLLNSRPLPVQMQHRQAPVYNYENLPVTTSISYPLAFLRDPGPDDLAETIDVQFTDEINDLAGSLNNSAVEIYQFVRNNCQFEAYLGSRKGAQQTLHHRSGNDYDQASLLIALLRTSGIPARYVKGSVEMPIDRATNWLGFQDSQNAASILTTCGMNGVLVNMNNEPYSIRCTRVWVEAWLPYINYRGAVNDSTGCQWVALDPAFKQYEYNPGINLPGEINHDGATFVMDYIMSGVDSMTPAEIFKQDLIDSLAIYHPDAEYDDLITKRTVIEDTNSILPGGGTLPYKTLDVDTAFSEIPNDSRYYIRFHVYNNGTTLDYTTSLPEIVEKQVTLSYIGATASDIAIIEDAGGIFNVTVPSTVDLKPVLKIDGCVVQTGTGSVMMGLSNNSDMHFIAPVGDFNEMPTVYNTVVAGNHQGIGIDTEDAFPAMFGSVETLCDEIVLGQEQHQLALTYLNKCDMGGDDIADLMHMVVMNDVAEAIVENSVSVYLDMWGNPTSMDWTGMTVDADRKIIGPFSVHGIDNGGDYMRIAGADGSIQENRLFEDWFDEEAISAVKILEIAADSGIAVCELFPGSSIASQCPGFDHTTNVTSAVQGSLNNGRHVIIPERSFLYGEWEGTGYIDLDPATGAAGYIISGGHNGGATVWTWFDPWFLWFWVIDCAKASGEVTIEPSATEDMYNAESWDFLTFIVETIDYYGNDKDGSCSLKKHTIDRRFWLPIPIKLIAWKWGPGKYVFRSGGNGTPCDQCTSVEKEFTIYKVDFKKLEFTSDHNVICDGNTITAAGSRFPNVEWDPTGSVNAPITHTAGNTATDKIHLTLTLEALGIPSNTEYTLTGSSAESALNFSKSGTISSGSNVTIPIIADNAIGSDIRKFESSITWTIDLFSTSIELGISGNHVIYTTLGVPDLSAPSGASIPNVPRMDIAVPVVANAISAAGGSGEHNKTVWQIVQAEGSYYLGVSLSDNEAWTLPSLPNGADCLSISKFVRNVGMAVGMPGSFDAETFAAYYRISGDLDRPKKSIAGITLNSPRINPGDRGAVVTPNLDPNWMLALADINCTGGGGQPGTVGCWGGLNAFEAAVIYTDISNKKWYFPGGTDRMYDDVDKVVQIFQTMAWVAPADHDNNPLTPDKLVVQAVDYTY